MYTDLHYFANERDYRKALVRAGQYGQQLKLREIFLVSFVESIDEETRAQFEVEYQDKTTGVKVVPIFVVTG
ncbi:MAG: hypothetical protein GY765_27950 [bacterium]|nr:hypothetical protein [bacterium]